MSDLSSGDGVTERDDVSGEDARQLSEPLTFSPDAVLVEAESLARTALRALADDRSVGALVRAEALAEHVVNLRFASHLGAYPGWEWVVTLSRIDTDAEPTVLETALLPGDGALLSPPWIPWVERLAMLEQEAQSEADEFDESDADGETESDAGEPGGAAKRSSGKRRRRKRTVRVDGAIQKDSVEGEASDDHAEEPGARLSPHDDDEDDEVLDYQGGLDDGEDELDEDDEELDDEELDDEALGDLDDEGDLDDLDDEDDDTDDDDDDELDVVDLDDELDGVDDLDDELDELDPDEADTK